MLAAPGRLQPPSQPAYDLQLSDSLRKTFMDTLRMLCLAQYRGARYQIVVFDREASILSQV